MSRPIWRHPRLACAAVATALLLCAALALRLATARAAGTSTQPASPAQLQQQIGAGQGRVSALSGAVSAANGKVNELNSSIATLQGHIRGIQTTLDSQRNQLLKLRTEETAARTRLIQLQHAERRAQAILSQQLVGSYEGDTPDVITVVLESTGFDNLLERLAFAQRIGQHDAQIAANVQASRRAVAAEATRLGALSVRQQQLTLASLYQRNRLARARLTLVKEQASASSTRDAAAQKLVAARHSVSSLRAQLSRLQAAPTAGGGGSAASHGSFVFPMPKGAVSPQSTWSLDDGVDISAPGGTPEFAVCSGTVVLHGIGGFGPSAPVLHCDSPLDGYAYVYYGHAGPGHWVSVGTHLSQGQQISEVGSGIVGISTGPHLEIGFATSSGSPVGPSSAGQMMSLLRSSF